MKASLCLVTLPLLLTGCISVAQREYPPRLEVIRLENASAVHVAKLLRNLHGNPEGFQVEADVRTNSIIIKGGRAEMGRIKDLIAQLDAEVE